MMTGCQAPISSVGVTFWPMSGEVEGFPRDEFSALIRRLPRYARLAWALGRDPRVSRSRRLAVLAGAAYVISPVDLVPGFIPLAGQLDDLFVALGAIRLALDGLKPEWRAERLGSGWPVAVRPRCRHPYNNGRNRLDGEVCRARGGRCGLARAGPGAGVGDRLYRAGWDLAGGCRVGASRGLPQLDPVAFGIGHPTEPADAFEQLDPLIHALPAARSWATRASRLATRKFSM